MADKNDFKKMMLMVGEIYDKSISDSKLLAYWSFLKDYDNEKLMIAIKKHVEDTACGQYFPKPADIIRHINGAKITAEQVIDAAQSAKTPLGVLAKIHIGNWDLENQNDFYLKNRAREFLENIDEIQDKAKTGSYSDHEIKNMVKHGVNPNGPLYGGLNTPGNQKELHARVVRLANAAKRIEKKPRVVYDKQKVRGEITKLKKILTERAIGR